MCGVRHEGQRLSELTPPTNADPGEANTRKSATSTRTRGKPFEPGNPGKPKGARHRTTKAVEALLDGEAEEITRKAIEAAKAGDMAAIKLCLDRIAPAQRERTVQFTMPPLTGAADLPAAVAAIFEAVAAGDLTPSEATQLAALVEAFRKQTETAELEARIKSLESLRGR